MPSLVGVLWHVNQGRSPVNGAQKRFSPRDGERSSRAMDMSAAGTKGEDRDQMARSKARKVVVGKAGRLRHHTLAGWRGLTKRCQL